MHLLYYSDIGKKIKTLQVNRRRINLHRNKAHLLLVDDDKRILSLLSAYLSKNEFLISSARNSTEARCLLDYFEFDLLVIDIMMPGENGLEFTKSLKKTNFDISLKENDTDTTGKAKTSILGEIKSVFN